MSQTLFTYGGLRVAGLPGLIIGLAMTWFIAFAVFRVLRRVGYSRRRSIVRLVLLLIPVIQLGVLAELAWGPWPADDV